MKNNQLMRPFCTYEVARAENGFIFGEYDMANDNYKVTIAATAEELGTVIRAWQEQRIASILRWASEELTRPASETYVLGPNGNP